MATRSRRPAAEKHPRAVAPLRPCPSAGPVGDDVLVRLGQWLLACDREEAAGPHVVIALGLDPRCFGPFETRALAQAAASAEAAEWRREFGAIEVAFDVVPLLEGCRIAPALR